MRKATYFLLLLIVLQLPGPLRAGGTEDRVIKILAIGNSFSADAIENSLFDLAREKNIQTVVANLYIGGAPVSLHVTNARENKNAYSYRKTAADGHKTTTANVSLEQAIADEDWDFISFQQASPLSGQFSTVEASLPEIYEYVKARAKNRDVKYVYHQTWAYSQHAVHTGFANYGRDQQQMYRAIADVSGKVSSIVPIDIVVPAGTAIQNARTSYIGDNFDRDGYHLRLSLGRYVAACTWFEKLFGVSVVGMNYKPADVSDREKEVAQYAAHFAVKNPYEVTPLKKFRKAPKGVKKLAAPVLVDFGGVSHEGAWNPVVSPLAGKVYDLKDSLLNTTRVKLEVAEGFNAKNGNGTTNPEVPYRFPKEVTGTSYFGNGKKAFNDVLRPEAKLRLTGLDKKESYDISFFASRMGDTLGRQDTRIVCEGATRQEGILNATDNVSELCSFSGVRPAADGTIVVTLTAGPENNNEYGLFYLSALRLSARGGQ